MTKIRLPNQLQNHAVLPIAYDRWAKVFLVGTLAKEVPPVEIVNELLYKPDTMKIDELPNLGFGVIDGTHFVTGPAFRELMTPGKHKLSQEIARLAVGGSKEVMSDVYCDLSASDSEVPQYKFTTTLDKKHGTVVLQNIYSGAVFKPALNGLMVRKVEERSTKFNQYASRGNGKELVTFLAGMGHIAHLAAQH